MNRRGPASRATLVSLLLLAACAAPKPPSEFEKDFEAGEKPWEEIQAQFPAAPKAADLAVFPVSGATSYTFAVDRKSISIGTDGVYRYTLVATSPSGARNVSYEGIRCETREKKLYATGRPDGTWVRSRNSAWSLIEEVGNNRQQAALMKDVFCPDYYATQNMAEIQQRLDRRIPNTVL